MRLQDDHLLELQEVMRTIGTYFSYKDFKNILEIGSRDGIESINMQKYFSKAKIYAFECNPDAISLCEKNLLNYENIFLEKFAVSNISGPITFYPIDPKLTTTTHKDGNIGASSLFKPNPDYPYEKYVVNEIQVEAITINDWAISKRIKEIDFMWIDVQGAELNVLKGASNFLNDVKAIYMEVEFKEMWVDQHLFAEVKEHFEEIGFKIIKLYGLNDWFGNVLLVNLKKVGFLNKLRIYFVSKYFNLFLKITGRI